MTEAWRHGEERLRPRQLPAPDPASSILGRRRLPWHQSPPIYGAPTLWDLTEAWRHGEERLRPRQLPAPDPASSILDSVLTPGTGGPRLNDGVLEYKCECQIHYVAVALSNHGYQKTGTATSISH
ncbi:unnamed protein product [Schistocephalus solidus]|uniref:Uncharacterized protein n=1 Tax=Schistocephalus solidus TaxID=70667 RepID=A0A3P7EX31_SCHSO|nr:unnamed protein product [Schistocephalus solidus]